MLHFISSPYNESKNLWDTAQTSSSTTKKIAYIALAIFLLIPVFNYCLYIAFYTIPRLCKHKAHPPTSSSSPLSPRSLERSTDHAPQETLSQATLQLFTLAKVGRCSKKDIDTVFKQGADPEGIKNSDDFKNTPLDWAIANANYTVAIWILQNIGSLDSEKRIRCVNHRSIYNNTPLHLSIGKGYQHWTYAGGHLTHSNLDVTSMLLKLGADPHLQSTHLVSPFELAILRREEEAIRACINSNPSHPELQKKFSSYLELSYEDACKTVEKTVFPILMPFREDWEAKQAPIEELLNSIIRKEPASK